MPGSTIISFSTALSVEELTLHVPRRSGCKLYLGATPDNDRPAALKVGNGAVSNLHSLIEHLYIFNATSRIDFLLFQVKSSMDHKVPFARRIVIGAATLDVHEASEYVKMNPSKALVLDFASDTDAAPVAQLSVQAKIAQRPVLCGGPGSTSMCATIKKIMPGRVLCGLPSRDVWIPTTDPDQRYLIEHDTSEKAYRIIPADVAIRSGVWVFPAVDL